MSATQIVTHPEPFKIIDPAEQQANRESLDQIRTGLQQGMSAVGRSVTALSKFVTNDRWKRLPGVPHDTLDDFIKAEFGFLPELVLPVPERRALVTLMAQAEMSQRAIAGRLGVSVGTVNGDCSKLNTRAVPDRRITLGALGLASRDRDAKIREMAAAGAAESNIIEATGATRRTVQRIAAEVEALLDAARNRPVPGAIPLPRGATGNNGVIDSPDPEPPGAPATASNENAMPDSASQNLHAEVANLTRERDHWRRRACQLTAVLQKNKIPVPAEPGAKDGAAEPDDAERPAADATFMNGLDRLEADQHNADIAAGIKLARRLYLIRCG
jgi:transposase